MATVIMDAPLSAGKGKKDELVYNLVFSSMDFLIMQARLTLIKLSVFLQILQESGTVTKALPTMQSQA